MDSILLLPGSFEFEQTLIRAWDILYGNVSPVCVIGTDGLPRSVNEDELEEYLEGGEYEERQSILELPVVVGTCFN
ncbi:MAG: hypothetical protein KME43_25365 [Myxacorys chilensis ATA2-1-KO14]|jgi:hypothetical protein|nr:hypothetical protein [Myxacorys chilensis ATA2-1-KO14]